MTADGCVYWVVAVAECPGLRIDRVWTGRIQTGTGMPPSSGANPWSSVARLDGSVNAAATIIRRVYLGGDGFLYRMNWPGA